MTPILLEIRDRGTFISALALRLESRTEAERYLLAQAGYGLTSTHHRSYVLLVKLNGGENEAHTDPFAWSSGARTMREAHRYISEHYDELTAGDVVDVEFLLKERDEPKVPQRLSQQMKERI